MVVINGALIDTPEDVCELNILQMAMKTLTIPKPRAYLLLTKFFYLKINKIELHQRHRLLVFTYSYLAKLHSGRSLPNVLHAKQTNKKN